MASAELIAIGDRTWVLGDWELKREASGLWRAVRIEGATPPLFAATIKSLEWLCRSWDRYIVSTRASAESYLQIKAKRQQQEQQAEPAAEEIEEELDEEPAEPEAVEQGPEPAEPLPSDDGADYNGLSDRVAGILARRRMALAG